MKRFVLSLFSALICCCGFAQETCSKTYMEALQAYQKGNYVEAQRLFTIVAQTCGDYSDVWKKMRECNKVIAEKHNRMAAEISSLKTEKKQLTSEKEKKESELKRQIAELRGEVLGQNKALKQRDDSIALLNSSLDMLNDSISSLKSQQHNLSLQIDSLVFERDSINSLYILEKEKSNKKKDKKQPEQEPASHRDIQPEVLPVVKDSANVVEK